MPSYRKHNPPTPAPPAPPLDLDAYSEATRRRLYDLAVAVHFPPRSEPADPDVYVPPYSPEEAGLLVLRMFGRWLCVWQPLEDLGEPFLPPDRYWVVLCITADPAAPNGVNFHEV
jgi:hypothetical protein